MLLYQYQFCFLNDTFQRFFFGTAMLLLIVPVDCWEGVPFWGQRIFFPIKCCGLTEELWRSRATGFVVVCLICFCSNKRATNIVCCNYIMWTLLFMCLWFCVCVWNSKLVLRDVKHRINWDRRRSAGFTFHLPVPSTYPSTRWLIQMSLRFKITLLTHPTNYTWHFEQTSQ